MARLDHGVQIANYEFLTCWQIIAQQFGDHVSHHARMKNSPDQGHQQGHEREKREYRVRGKGEGEGVHVGAQQIFYGGDRSVRTRWARVWREGWRAFVSANGGQCDLIGHGASLNPIKGSRRYGPRKGTKVMDGGRSFLIQHKRLCVTLGHNSDLPLILLAKRFTTA